MPNRPINKFRLGRRSALAGMGSALAAPLLGRRAGAQDAWPSRPVKLIVPYGPGGAGDTIARPWAERLGQAFNQTFVVENRGGASGAIGTEAAARSAPDGYTFLATTSAPITALPQLRKVSYDPRKDLMPVGRMGDTLGGFVIHPKHGLKTLAEVVEYARKNPGKLTFGSAGLGTSTQMRLEMLKLRAKVDILHVPYRGSADALNDLLAGHVDMMNEIVVLPHAKAGKLNLLAVNYAERNPEFPDTPTLTEAGYPDSDVPIWYSIWAPMGTPKEIVAAMSAKMIEIGNSESMRKRLREINTALTPMTAEELGAFYDKDRAQIGMLIKEANIRLE